MAYWEFLAKSTVKNRAALAHSAFLSTLTARGRVCVSKYEVCTCFLWKDKHARVEADFETF